MTFQEFLKKKGMTVYSLSKLSGVPRTTITDISSGKSQIENCSSHTLYMLSKSLDCSMEFLLELDHPSTRNSSKKIDKTYLEYDLPAYLKESIKKMDSTWQMIDSGNQYLSWDLDWYDLCSDINSAEVNQEISSEQAWYLREKYLRMKKEEFIK